MIDLYQFSPAFDVPSLSPFCMKLEAFLQVTNIPFQIIHENDPRKGPKGKLPFIRDNGVIIGDTELIIDYLESKLNFCVDGHLDTRTAATHHAFTRMLEEHLYWVLMYSRWIDDKNWPTLRNELFYDIPPPISTLQAGKLRKRIREQLEAQGIGRHSREDIYTKGCKDLEQLSELLGDNKWFGGNYVSKLDLTAIGYLCNMLIPELHSPLADCIKNCGNLEVYAVRAKRILFPNPIAKPKRPQY
jgi:hypothetical protein